jgi:hypothetical protein
MSVSTDRTIELRIQAETILNELASERDGDWGNDVASSIAKAAEALKLARRIGWHQGTGLALLQVARRKQPREAARVLRRALALFRRLGDRIGEIRTLNNLALIYRHQGQNALAVHFLTTASAHQGAERCPGV